MFSAEGEVVDVVGEVEVSVEEILKPLRTGGIDAEWANKSDFDEAFNLGCMRVTI